MTPLQVYVGPIERPTHRHLRQGRGRGPLKGSLPLTLPDSESICQSDTCRHFRHLVGVSMVGNVQAIA